MMVKKTFLRHNGRRNEEESDERAELHQRHIVKAIRDGDERGLRRLLVKVPEALDWTFCTINGENLPLLHLAVQEGQTTICKELVERFGLSVHACSPLGVTTLWRAVDRHCHADDAEIVDYLLRAGAGVDVISRTPAGGQSTPLLQAILLQQKDDVACLLRYGANPFALGRPAPDAAREVDPLGCGQIYRMVKRYSDDYLKARIVTATTTAVPVLTKMQIRRPR